MKSTSLVKMIVERSTSLVSTYLVRYRFFLGQRLAQKKPYLRKRKILKVCMQNDWKNLFA